MSRFSFSRGRTGNTGRGQGQPVGGGATAARAGWRRGIVAGLTAGLLPGLWWAPTAVAVLGLLCLPGCGGSSSGADAVATPTPTVVAPAITTQPASVSVAAGGSTSLAVVATGTGLSYQWRLGGVAIGGATAATLSLTNASAAQAGNYDVVVSNSAGSITSAVAVVTVQTAAAGAPVITAQPVSVTASLGSAVTLQVGATGATAYAWRKGGVAIPGATDSRYTLAAVSAADAGSYDVVVSNAAGSTASVAVTVAVNASGAGTNTAEVVRAAEAFVATLSATQRASLEFSWALDTVRRWSNLPAAMVRRNGVAFSALTAPQAAAALALADAALGATGRQLLDDIRIADNFLVASGANPSQYGDGNYYVAFVGSPSTSSLWTLQIGGHHLAFNLTYNGGTRSTTPMFLGVEPSGTFSFGGRSVEPMAAQNAAASELLTALSGYGGALLAGRYDDVLFAANGAGGIDGTMPKAYPTGSTGRGVLVGALAPTDQARVRAMISAWVNTQHPEAATELLANYLDPTALAQTYVAYATASSISTVGAYVRVDGPRVWIEYSSQRGIILSPAHPHTVWRDKTADYGGRF